MHAGGAGFADGLRQIDARFTLCFAWTGHYGFEKNRPATFRHPFYSLLGDGC